MSGLIAPFLCAVAGICGLTAIQHILLAQQPRRRTAHVAFVLLSLSIAGFELATLVSYQTSSVEIYVSATRWLADFGCLGGVFTMWFAASYSRAKLHRAPWTLTAIFAVLIAANHLLPDGVILQPGGRLGPFTLPWGETISRIRGAFNPIAYVYYGAFIAVAFYCLSAGSRLRQAGRKRRGLALGFGGSVMAAAMASDVLMEQQVLETLYFSDYAFLPLVILMNVALVAELSASEARHVKLFRNSPDAILISRLADGRILETNERFGVISGIPPELAIGRTTVELGLLASPESRAPVTEAAKSRGFLRDHEFSFRRSDGSIRSGLLSMEVIEIQGEQCLINTVRDITDRKADERALRASQERFELAVRGTSDGIWDWDIPTDTVYYAPRFLELLGYSAEEFPQGRESFISRIHPDDLDRVLEAVRAHLEERAPYDIDLRVRRGDGGFRWFRARAQAIWDASGQAVRMAGSISDIHEHRQAAEALRRSEAEFRAIFENSAIGIAVVSTESEILTCNPALCRFLGYSADELRSRPYGEKTHPDDRGVDQEKYRELLSGRRTFLQDEKRYIHKDGHVVWGHRTVSIVHNDDGSVRCAIGMVEDITERRSTEESLRLAHEREARTHAEFTRRLLLAQEHERKRLATDLHDGLGQHLSLIKNRTSLATEQLAVPSAVAKHLDSILHVITAAISEVRNLALQLRPLHIDKFGLTSSIESLVDQVADSSGLTIDRRIENVDDLLQGDEAAHVYRILQEALNNMLRHAQTARARVALERDVHCIRLRVEDDGRGFDVTAPTAGAGLGLVSIRERAALIRGRVELHSTPGVGTRLMVELPFAAHVAI